MIDFLLFFFKSLLIIPRYFSSVKISIDVIISLLTLNKILFSIDKEIEEKIIEKMTPIVIILNFFIEIYWFIKSFPEYSYVVNGNKEIVNNKFSVGFRSLSA